MEQNEITVWVCSNTETLADGVVDLDSPDRAEIANAYTLVACRMIDDSGLAVSRCDERFPNWHGGMRCSAGKAIGGRPWGHRAGWIACHERDVTPELRAVMDEADQAGRDAMEEAARGPRRDRAGGRGCGVTDPIIRGGQGHPDAEVESTGAVVGIILIGLLAFGAGLLLGWAVAA